MKPRSFPSALRDTSPQHELRQAAASGLRLHGHDRDLLRRADVVAGRERLRLVEAERLGDLLAGRGLVEAAAHGRAAGYLFPRESDCA